MRCPNCNQKVPKGETKCPSCGAPIKKSGRRTLGGAIFVILFVLIVSAVLIFFNLKGRGDLPAFNFDTIRSIFVKDKEAAEPVEEPEAADDPETAEEPEAAGEQETAEEPETAGEPETAEEPEAAGEPETAEEPEALSAEPVDEPEASEPEDAREATPLETWRGVEREHAAQLLRAWNACLEADENAPDQLLRGDAQLLLRLCLSLVLDDGMQARLSLQSDEEPESWDLFAAEADAVFLPVLALDCFDALLGDYIDLVLDAVEDVSVGGETLEAEGILARCRCFRVDLDAAAVRRIASSLIGTLRWDERFSRFLSQEDYKALLARLDELDYALDSRSAAEDAALHMLVYVDEGGQVCGRSLRLESEKEARQLLLALPRDAEDLGLELSVRDKDGLRALAGRGVLTEDAFRGNFRLLRDGKAAAAVTAGLTE